MAETFTLPARNALAFARSHDWGRGAELTMLDNVETVVGLEDWYSTVGPDGRVVAIMEPASTVATVRALREFGNY